MFCVMSGSSLKQLWHCLLPPSQPVPGVLPWPLQQLIASTFPAPSITGPCCAAASLQTQHRGTSPASPSTPSPPPNDAARGPEPPCASSTLALPHSQHPAPWLAPAALPAPCAAASALPLHPPTGSSVSPRPLGPGACFRHGRAFLPSALAGMQLVPLVTAGTPLPTACHQRPT